MPSSVSTMLIAREKWFAMWQRWQMYTPGPLCCPVDVVEVDALGVFDKLTIDAIPLHRTAEGLTAPGKAAKTLRLHQSIANGS